MRGYKITINDKLFFVASDSLVAVHIGAGCRPEDNNISIMGLDSKSYHLNWCNQKLEIGDKIKVLVTEIDNISPLQSRTLENTTGLLKMYYEYKEALEKKRMI